MFTFLITFKDCPIGVPIYFFSNVNHPFFSKCVKKIILLNEGVSKYKSELVDFGLFNFVSQ